MQNSRYYQKCITAGRAAEGLRADWQQQLRELQREIGFSYIRFHGLFHDDMAIYQENEDGSPRFYFGYFDKLMDFLQSVSLKPLLELGFMPSQLAVQRDTVFWWHANGSPPTSYEKWAMLVETTVRHAIERYGLEEVKTWYFEVWNEPNLGFFWRGTQAEYFRLYEVSVRTIKNICPDLRVGGPSTSGADFREDLHYLQEFIGFCQKHNLPVDFFSAHPYPTYWPLDTAGNKQMGYMEADANQKHLSRIRQIRDHSPYPQAKIHLTEWNSSPSPRDLIHDTPFMAPFILYNISTNFDKVDSLGFWTFTDVFEENGPGEQPFHGGFGLINADGIKKPSYWAYWFLSQLGDEIISAEEDRILSRDGEDYVLLVWNFCYYQKSFALGDRRMLSLECRDAVFETRTHKVELEVDMGGSFTQETYTLDQSSSALHNWVKAGSPQYPSREMIRQLQADSAPRCQSRAADPAVSVYRETLELQPHEAKMIRLKKVSPQNS